MKKTNNLYGACKLLWELTDVASSTSLAGKYYIAITQATTYWVCVPYLSQKVSKLQELINYNH